MSHPYDIIGLAGKVLGGGGKYGVGARWSAIFIF